MYKPLVTGLFRVSSGSLHTCASFQCHFGFYVAKKTAFVLLILSPDMLIRGIYDRLLFSNCTPC